MARSSRIGTVPRAVGWDDNSGVWRRLHHADACCHPRSDGATRQRGEAAIAAVNTAVTSGATRKWCSHISIASCILLRTPGRADPIQTGVSRVGLFDIPVRLPWIGLRQFRFDVLVMHFPSNSVCCRNGAAPLATVSRRPDRSGLLVEIQARGRTTRRSAAAFRRLPRGSLAIADRPATGRRAGSIVSRQPSLSK